MTPPLFITCVALTFSTYLPICMIEMANISVGRHVLLEETTGVHSNYTKDLDAVSVSHMLIQSDLLICSYDNKSVTM